MLQGNFFKYWRNPGKARFWLWILVEQIFVGRSYLLGSSQDSRSTSGKGVWFWLNKKKIRSQTKKKKEITFTKTIKILELKCRNHQKVKFGSQKEIEGILLQKKNNKYNIKWLIHFKHYHFGITKVHLKDLFFIFIWKFGEKILQKQEQSRV